MFQGISLTYEACWSRRRVTRDFHDYNATQCTTSQAFFVLQKRRENVGNARACGSQRPAAGVTQAIRAVLMFSEMRTTCQRNRGAVRCVTMETMRDKLWDTSAASQLLSYRRNARVSGSKKSNG